MCNKCDSDIEVEQEERNEYSIDRVRRCGNGHVIDVVTVRQLDRMYKTY